MNFNINITNYKLEFITQKLKNSDEIQHTEIFAIVKLQKKKLQNFYDNVTLFFLSQFDLKLFIEISQ